MVVKLSLSPAAAAALTAKAAAAGVDVETYAARHLERLAAPPRSLLDISGPAHDEFRAAAMTDDQLADLLERAKHDARTDRHARRQAS
jgi:hypothetical protein